jgi:hypothetical protein
MSSQLLNANHLTHQESVEEALNLGTRIQVVLCNFKACSFGKSCEMILLVA